MRAFFIFILTLLGIQTQIPPSTPISEPTPYVQPSPTPVSIRSVQLAVPFTSQAPFGEWSDERQQDSCEEASVFMAVSWARKEAIPDKQFAKDTLIAMHDYQVAHWGSGIDTSARDTLDRLVSGYFAYPKAVLLPVGSVEDIVRVLMQGNLVIVPTNGTLLGNPNFTNGGPERHMLVIKGYDLAHRQFITNDPGTRQGENYRYDQAVLFKALRDYVTGDHEPIVGVNKVMISVTSTGP